MKDTVLDIAGGGGYHGMSNHSGLRLGMSGTVLKQSSIKAGRG